MINPEHVKLLLGRPENLVTSFMRGEDFPLWNLKADHLRKTVNQEILKSMYLIILEAVEKPKLSKKWKVS